MKKPERALDTARFLLPAIFLVALALRLVLADKYGLWGDEVESIKVASKGLPFIFDSRFGWAGNQTVGHYLLTWLMLQPLDPATSSLLVRLPSILAGALLPVVTFGLVRELFNKQVALLAALIAVFSPILLDYSHDVRPYSLLVFFTTLSLYCLLRAYHTNNPRWWIAFTLASIANVLNSYIAITIVLPSLAIAFALVLWKIWSQRQTHGTAKLLYFVASFILLALVSVFQLLDLLGSQRTSPDLSKLSISSVVQVLMATVMSFTKLGLQATLSSLISLALLLLAMAGLYLAIRSGYAFGAAICASTILLASFLLAILSTASVIASRYTLFVGPFYYALGAAGAVLLVPMLRSYSTDTPRNPASRLEQIVTLAIVILFAFGAFNYAKSDTHSLISYRPDFRGAARYLEQVASPSDTIILFDGPPLGYEVTGFYLHPQSNLTLFAVRDPRLYTEQPGKGSIYWVVNSLDGQIVRDIASTKPDWLETVQLEGVAILKENPNGRLMQDLVADMSSRLNTIAEGYQPLNSIKGTLAEARNNITEAAQLYRDAGVYFPIGGEYARAAQGFARQGFVDDAWKQILVADFMEPARAETHLLMSDYLKQMGYPNQSANELAMSNALAP